MFISKQGKINFVDLAGSEMTKKTQSEGKTLEEANNINKSLMVLGKSIYAVLLIIIVTKLFDIIRITRKKKKCFLHKIKIVIMCRIKIKYELSFSKLAHVSH